MKKIKFLTTILTTVFSATIFAEGAYIGAGFAINFATLQDGARFINTIFDSNFYPSKTYSPSIFIGHKFDKFAVEFGSERLANIKSKVHVNDASQNYEAKLKSLYTDFLYNHDFNNKVSVMIGPGIALVHAKQNISLTMEDQATTISSNSITTKLRLSAIANYKLTDKVDVRASYRYVQGLTYMKRMNLVGVGVTYSFA